MLSKPPRLAAVSGAKVLGEAAVGRVEVEEPRRRRAAEAVDDLGRRADARARAEQVLLVVHEHRELALEDVERVGVLPVEVRLRPGPRVREPGLGDAEVVEARLDRDPPAEEGVALARAEEGAVDADQAITAARPTSAVARVATAVQSTRRTRRRRSSRIAVSSAVGSVACTAVSSRSSGHGARAGESTARPARRPCGLPPDWGADSRTRGYRRTPIDKDPT